MKTHWNLRLGRRRAALALAAALILATQTSAVTIDTYAWLFPRATAVSGADDLTTRLRDDVQTILNAGHLAPARNYYADIDEEYWLFNEPCRIVATLAWAYPHLTAAQRQAARSYVAAELNDLRYVPWNGNPWDNYYLPSNLGTPRERHPSDLAARYNGAWGSPRPTVHVVYGLWLYGYRTGDWATIQAKWSNIKSFYSNHTGQADLYGTMSAHVAMARMADKFGDTSMRTAALANLQTQLNNGTTFANIEANCWNKSPYWVSPYLYMWDSRKEGLLYRGFMFLNLTPEIARYLKENVGAATLQRHNQGKSDFPYWWMMETEHFGRHTGDEGVGFPSEMMGMIMPVERWVAEAPASTLRGYMRSWTNNIGDCYWLEALVSVIEAHGTTTWVDVRTTPGDATPPVAPGNLRIR
jgi:hypothetical protein